MDSLADLITGRDPSSDSPSLQVDGSSFPPLRKPVSQPPRGPPAQQSLADRSSSPPPLRSFPAIFPLQMQGGCSPRNLPLHEDGSPLPPSPGVRMDSSPAVTLAAAKLSEGSGSLPGLVVLEAPAPIIPIT